jgi:uncharacterized protein (TIGR00369 family)
MEVFYRMPIARRLGMRMIARSAAETVLALEARPEFLQEDGAVHRGILTVLADTAAGYAVYPDLTKNWAMTSIEFKMNFLGPATLDGGTIAAHASVVRQDPSVALCEVDVRQSGERVARGVFTYLLFDRGRSS